MDFANTFVRIPIFEGPNARKKHTAVEWKPRFCLLDEGRLIKLRLPDERKRTSSDRSPDPG